MSFPGRWLCFAARVAFPLDTGFLRAPLLEWGFDMEKPSANYSTQAGWRVLQGLAQLSAPHLEEAAAQKELGRKLAWALKEQNFVKSAHLGIARHLPSTLRMLSLQKLARGTPFAYVYKRECAGLWKLSFEEGMLMPLSLGMWEVFGEWLGKRWVVSAGPVSTSVLFVQEG
jgi:hypothetical protein